ncbi:MAG: ATP-dependent RecD-like DNA helicase [Clostridia bacterium]|nr:ATP-dependent RecD-like DNA helicase [Clostridia bacterium]
MEQIRCLVERITFESDTFSVLRCRVKGYQDTVTVVGSMPGIHVGSVVAAKGVWRMDKTYGRQFSVTSYEEALPASVYGIQRYLGSGLVKGIGKIYSKKIVDRFGADTFKVIEETPERLMEVPGIGRERVKKIKASWDAQREVKNIMVFLQGHEVSVAHAAKIYKTYGNESIQVVTENPYRLADDIWGIGFKTADQIAAKMGFEKERYERLRSGILYTLNKLSELGHCYATRTQLLDTGTELLEVERSVLEKALEKMIGAEDLRTQQMLADHPLAADEAQPIALFLPAFYYAEIGIAARLKRIFRTPASVRPDEALVQEQLGHTSGIQYDDIQMQAILTAAKSKIMVLTGGPGTGKSTTTLGIIRAFQTCGAHILLAAPTGRAAKRLSEVTSLEAKTCHRLLEFKPPQGYQRNEEKPLEGDVLILDECSMIDTILMNSLLKAVPDSMRLILVGDVDQLPSVGAGNVLRDIISSAVFPVVRLTRIFRQAAASRIITNAHRINQGEFPDLGNRKGTDFFFIEQEDPEKASGEIVRLVQSRLPGFFGVRPSEIQVLTPMQRGNVGAAALNEMLQRTLNPLRNGQTEVKRGGTVFRVYDKVMQIRNNYDKEVFNGDIGRIMSLDSDEETVQIAFDDRLVEYELSELDEVVLAYATTIHKAQGAEYPVVVMPVMMTHYVMLQRNLLYTGITRAKRGLVLVGTKKAIAYCVNHVTVSSRNTLLTERLNGTLPAAQSAAENAGNDINKKPAVLPAGQIKDR